MARRETLYVPVLRSKRSERIALRELYENDRKYVVPLVEFVPPDYELFKIEKAGGH